MKIVNFWKPHEKNGFLSQWYRAPFKEDGIQFFNAEQYMMYQKAMLFNDEKTAARILRQSDPKKIKALGREVRGFREDVWEDNKYQIVVQGNLLKFGSNQNLLKMLTNTGDAYLVETSPYDRIWGVGTSSANPDDWNGQNLLGKALMEVRHILCVDIQNSAKPDHSGAFNL